MRIKKISVGFFVYFLIAGNIYSASLQRYIYSNYLKGTYALNKEEHKEALEYFSKVRKKDPNSLSVRLNILTSLIYLKDYDIAEKELLSLKKDFPDELSIDLSLAMLYELKGDKVKSKKSYEDYLDKLLLKEPENEELMQYVGGAYWRIKSYTKALEIYNKLYKKNPQNPDIVYMVGFIYDSMGERKKAIEVWKENLKNTPHHADTLNALGYVYAEENMNLEEAQSMIEKALELSPDNPAYLDSLGWVYFQKKDYQKAESYIKRASKMIVDPVIYEHLGDIYVALDKKELALQYYKKALEIIDEEKKEEKVKEKIKRLEDDYGVSQK